MEGNAKRKYFEHAGALLTADGTDDELIKFEGTPPGYRARILHILYVNGNRAWGVEGLRYYGTSLREG